MLPEDVLACGDDGDALSGFFLMQEHHVEDCVKKAFTGLASRITSAIKKGVDAKSAQQSTANRGCKFTDEFRGGCIDDFYAGVTGIVGDLHVNIKENIFKEHVLMKDSKQLFTAGNYGITTNPKNEYQPSP